jgi:hypothetical protein
MIREQTLRARQKLIGNLPIIGELLRGSLLERTVRHTKDCPKCARGVPRSRLDPTSLARDGAGFESKAC